MTLHRLRWFALALIAMRLLRIASGAILVLCVPKYALGITTWLELGAYLPLYTITGDERPLIDGAKVRALFFFRRMPPSGPFGTA